MELTQPIAGAAPSSRTGQTWDTAAYARNGRFVADLASAVVGLLAPQLGERILDIGCGDGALTEQIAATGAVLTGIDASPSMVEAAQARGLDVRVIPATELPFQHEFDAAFSNAALHWIPETDQPVALARIHAAIQPGGRFVAEMGGLGNIAAIRTALSATLAPFGLSSEHVANSFYPAPGHYAALLEAAGFTVHAIDLIPRPTPLPGGTDGMRTWLNTFRNGVLDLLGPEDRAAALEQTVALLTPILRDNAGNWTADYVRLRFRATANP